MDAVLDNSITSPSRQIASTVVLSGWMARPSYVQQVKQGSMASTYEGVVGDKFIQELGHLEEDWDGYGAASIDISIILRAREIYAALVRQLPAPDISPNPNGTISFEWTKDGASAHYEVGRNGYSFYLTPQNGESQYAKNNHSAVDTQWIAGIIADQLFSGMSVDYSVGNFQWWESSVHV